MTKAITLGISALALTGQIASANLTFDLRATGPGANATGKQYQIPASGGTVVQFEIWAQVTSATGPGNNIFGVQTILGAVVSTGSTGIVGSLSPMTFPPVFSASAIPGAQAELSLPPDTIGDLGTSSTSSTANYPKPRKDPTTGGEAVIPGSTMFATNNQPAGATVHAITNGFEFLMGFTTLNITDIAGPSAQASLNWKIPAFVTAANRGALGVWTDGDGLNSTGSAQFAELFVGSPVSLVVIPEPSAFGMVLLGAMGLVGFRRLGVRHS